jgi:hypothetical protein
MRASTIALLAAILSVITLASGAATSSAQEPDTASLLQTVTTQDLLTHIETIAVPRNAFAQPEQLQATADYVQSKLESFGYDVTLDDVANGDVTFPNVTAKHAGTSCPERIFIAGAHYDSVRTSPGADDDASGTAAMLELAQALADTPLPATVWFTGFTMEEDGLIGSRAMAQELSDQNAEVVGMMSLEMLGYTSGPGNDFLAVLGNTASVRLTDAVHRAAQYVPGFPLVVLNLEGNGEEQPDSRRSDHSPFWDRGYQALLVTDTANFRNPNYHQPSDTVDTLDFDFMAKSAKAMLATTIDYLTYDGDTDGEPDVCSGPLAATPTITQPATPTMTPDGTGPFPPHTATPTATLAPDLPPTGLDRPAASDPAITVWIWLTVITAVACAAGGLAMRGRP